jgi:hypothetical protein
MNLIIALCRAGPQAARSKTTEREPWSFVDSRTGRNRFPGPGLSDAKQYLLAVLPDG